MRIIIWILLMQLGDVVIVFSCHLSIVNYLLADQGARKLRCPCMCHCHCLIIVGNDQRS